MVALVVVPVWPAWAVNDPLDVPPAIVTLAGTVTTPDEELSGTLTPPPGALPDNVTVQADWPPGRTVEGAQDNAETTGAG